MAMSHTSLFKRNVDRLENLGILTLHDIATITVIIGGRVTHVQKYQIDGSRMWVISQDQVVRTEDSRLKKKMIFFGDVSKFKVLGIVLFFKVNFS